ncbi:protocadherin gamma-C5-like isoform X6 [Ambystoma mexicanum]|uniref:protocadherin gamma-C5-like isoform X6 n=1 Tax=Ambystoma mexicanum TaxID=8296 RepID=UPI0037E96079
MDPESPMRTWRCQALCLFLLWGCVSAKLRYSVLEESEPGTVVGNVARDLGLDAAALSGRRLRLGSESSAQYLTVDLLSGDLMVNEKMDRESLCAATPTCILTEELVIETPLELVRLEVEVLDVNDNAPSFLTADHVVRITEVATAGSRFPLESAIDPDIGMNAVSNYKLSSNEHFSLDVKQIRDGKLLPALVLEKPLDREAQEQHQLILTASDGGSPARTGTARITVIVLDVNDNAPVFNQSVYKVKLSENAPLKTSLITLSATDSDEGLNGQVEYSFDKHTAEAVRRLFYLNSRTGEVGAEGAVDFEESDFYELHVKATDRGVPQMQGGCVIQVEIEDVNDNAPEVILTSLAHSVPENAAIGTAVGLFRVRDRDSGLNGKVHVDLSPGVPFKIRSFENHYSLVTDGQLDRESRAQYSIQLSVSDSGSPPLHTQKSLVFNISDVNDNPPQFSQPFINAYIRENNEAGALLCTVSASDPDEGENSRITYSIAEKQIEGSPVSSFLYISSNTGHIYAQRSFDYEFLQVLQINVLAEDGGHPKLSSNVSVLIYISDQNDNAPVLVHPAPSRELTVDLRIPPTFPVGYLVTKITAVDADSGHNAWISYSILQSPDPTLFRISPYTGELRAAKSSLERGNLTQKLLILAKDNGAPPLSTTVTILLLPEEHAILDTPTSHEYHQTPRDGADMTLYLIVSLVAISVLCLVTFIILSAKCIVGESPLTSVCCCADTPQTADFTKQTHPTLQLNADGSLTYGEVSMRPSNPLTQGYRACLSQVSDTSDFTFMKPPSFPEPTGHATGTDPFMSGAIINELSQQAQPFQQSQPFQQAPPNTDWRFSQAQRPGTSGSQNSEEAGGWPNNQFETERLQAMILASANEGADGSSTLGGGAGTMGLSTRYGPQFTLQHVPDYRQNVYIPGSTATLTNAAGKRDGKSAAASGGNKKKSGKKEKK